MAYSDGGSASDPLSSYDYTITATGASPSDLPTDIYVVAGGYVRFGGSYKPERNRVMYTVECRASGQLGLTTSTSNTGSPYYYDVVSASGTLPSESGTTTVEVTWTDAAMPDNPRVYNVTVHCIGATPTPSPPSGTYQVRLYLRRPSGDKIAAKGELITNDVQRASTILYPTGTMGVSAVFTLQATDMQYDSSTQKWYTTLTAACSHTKVAPESSYSVIAGYPWRIQTWSVNSQPTNSANDSETFTFCIEDDFIETATTGTYEVLITVVFDTSCCRICLDSRMNGGDFIDYYLYPGESFYTPYNDIIVESENRILVRSAINEWTRCSAPDNRDADVQLQHTLAPGITVEYSAASFWAENPPSNRIVWYRASATVTELNEDQDAILIFDSGGGTFKPMQRVVSPYAYTSSKRIGFFIFDSVKDLWIWMSGINGKWCRDDPTIQFDVLNDVNFEFYYLPHTQTINGVDYSVETLEPPVRIKEMLAWETESPYFKGTQDPDAGYPVRFSYTIPGRKMMDGMVRRTFYPHWNPSVNMTDKQIAVITTPGHKTITISNVTSVSETYSVTLEVKPIVCFGYNGTFCMDLGVTKTVSIGYTKAARPLTECDDTSGNSELWSTARWIKEFKNLLNRWQMMTNGSELYLLRPGQGRLSTDTQDTDPMRQYYTRIMGENCYITSLPITYDENPYAIRGMVDFTIGTLYPKKTALPMIEMKYFCPLINDPSALPGTSTNPYDSLAYALTKNNYTSLPEHIYILNSTNEHDTQIRILGTQNFTFTSFSEITTSVSAIFADDGPHYGLTLQTEEYSASFGFQDYSYNVYSIVGTLDPSHTGDATIQLKVGTFFMDSPLSVRTITLHLMDAPQSSTVDEIEYYYAKSLKYPASGSFMLPYPTTVFGSAATPHFITEGDSSNPTYSVTGANVYAWKAHGGETEFIPKTIHPVNTFLYNGGYEVYGVADDVSDANSHFFFPGTELHNNQRRVWVVTITPASGLEMSVRWGLVGGGGGGGGSATVKYNNTMAYLHSGAGGGAGGINANYTKQSSGEMKFVVKCGGGGAGGQSYHIALSPSLGSQSTGDGGNGGNGKDTLLYTRSTVDDVTTDRLEAFAYFGYGGKGAKASNADTGIYAEGGKSGDGLGTGGRGSDDYEGYGGAGSRYGTNSLSGRGGSGGPGERYFVQISASAYSRELHIPGGGGGAGGPYMDGMNYIGNGGNGARAGTPTTGSSTGGEPTEPGYGAGGGGGGGCLTYDSTAPVTYGYPHNGMRGGNGWAYVIISNGSITDIVDQGWENA